MTTTATTPPTTIVPTPPPASNAPAVPDSESLPTLRASGPARTQRKTSQARMQASPLPLHAPRYTSKKTSRAKKAPVAPIEAEYTEHSPPSQPIPTSHLSDSQPPSSQLPDHISDTVLHTPTGPNLDLSPSASDGMSIDEEVLPAATSAPCHSVIEVRVIPAFGTSALVETSPPALLFADVDEPPNWLLVSIKDCLRHTPYYLCLNEVVDLFLAQEARLGYLAQVRQSDFMFHLLIF